jgi:hypothetical protein
MKYLIYLVLFFIFIGCGNNVSYDDSKPIKIENIHYKDLVKEDTKVISFANSDAVKYLPYRPMVLGKGLLYQTLNNAFRELKKRRRDIFSKPVKLSVKFTDNTIYKYDFINEVRIFTKENNFGFIEPKNIIQKLLRKRVKKGRIKYFNSDRIILTLFFEPLKDNKFMLYITDNSNIPLIEPIQFDLKKLENEKNSIWTTVYVPYGNTNIDSNHKDKYLVLKDVVSQNSLVVTNKTFEQGDKICRKRYKGASIISLYVFEYALRNGLIRAPQNGTYREFVAPYDEDLGDKKYLNYGDKVKINDDNDPSESQVLVYNWNKREYEKVLINYNKNIAFRCMLFKGRE